MKYNYLAIDILLSIFCYKNNKFYYINKHLTKKIELKNSVDKNYIGLLNSLFWFRRLEQHQYNRYLSTGIYFNLDFFITYLISLIFFIYSKIFTKFK